MNRQPRTWSVILALMLLGFGCDSTPVSDLTPEEASASLGLAIDNEIVLRPTVLGIGGKIVDLLGGEADERTIKITQWTPGISVDLSWSITTQTETAASVAAREAYAAQYGETAIGEDVPDAPEPIYEDTIKSGSLGSASLAGATMLELPELWSEGDGGVSDTSLIWISKAHYDELVSTRRTKLSLGLFDESILQVQEVTDQLTSYLDRIKSLWPGNATGTPAQTQADDLLTVQAKADWGEYTLLVDGTRTTVQTIEAKNVFATYTILANPENPLILELRLTPLSQGNLEVLSPSGFIEGFGGYEVSQINLKTGS
ncbi:hypothetical protein HZA87_01305 [Candidatus Uhrbacteria bacterium]|nr:hypothetical protein [Candidatus Uhrbacteria bacterium]